MKTPILKQHRHDMKFEPKQNSDIDISYSKT